MSANTNLPIQQFQSGQLLNLSSNCSGGLILRKTHYCEVVGPDAAVGGSFDTNVTAVYTIGEVEMEELAGFEPRKQAFQARAQYLESLQQVTGETAPIKRAHLLLSQMEAWFGKEEVDQIPDEWLAGIGGVLPRSIAAARRLPREQETVENCPEAQLATVG